MRDDLTNPFTPGYGALPRVFAGREAEFRDLEVMAVRTRGGVYEQARRVQGIRGIGKTVLLGEFEQWATDGGWWVTSLTVAPGAGLVGRLARSLAATIAARSPGERAARAVLDVLRAIAAVGLRYGGQDWHLEYRGRRVEPAPAATGDPQEDLRRLLVDAALLARSHGAGLVLLLDEAQNAPTAELAPLLYALQDAQKHVITEQDPVSGRVSRSTPPLAVVLAGLPNLPDALARAAATFMARSKPVVLGPLPEPAVRQALPDFTVPLGVTWEADALDAMVKAVGGYPYFLHVYGSTVWSAGDGPVIAEQDVRRGAAAARPLLSAFYDERLDRLSGLQREALEALARLAPGERSGERVAELLGRRGSESVGSTMRRLIEGGLVVRVGRGAYEVAIPGLAEHLAAGDPGDPEEGLTEATRRERPNGSADQ